MDEIFLSAVRSAGDLAGIFEHDGDAGTFYLYETRAEETHKVVADIQVVAGSADLTPDVLSVRWSRDERFVGLFIRDTLWAAFEAATRQKHGGGYRPGAAPSIPPAVAAAF